jgi:acetylornithine deacetylase/succinyl-diaminopimelate desuccinylase-like protein
MEDINQYLQNNKQRLLDELFDLLKIPSVSADPAYATDVHNAAEFIKNEMIKIGLDNVSVEETPGYPIVYAEKIIDSSLPTVLIYGHYDVQPADPIELWESDPFEPVIKKTELHPEGAIFARGASDDKGQMYMHLKAVEFLLKNNTLPVNVKFMIEGEEEVGSPSLAWYLSRNQQKLKNDVIIISDTGMVANDVPAITTGLRGLAYVEVEVTGPNRDLHSGLYGGAVANPANVLAKMITKLTDENNKITIPGFYDKVKELTPQERQEIAKTPFDLEQYKKELGIDDVYGEKGFSTLERQSIRPTLDVNGMWSGYTGEGGKTIIPSKAYAKISMRLVPDQDPDEIPELFEKYFKSIAPKAVKVKVTNLHGGYPYVTPTDSPGYKAAAEAIQKSFGKAPIPIYSGGSIPIVPMFEKELGSKSILMGFGLNSDAIHSPNEHYGVFNYYKGIETISYFYDFYKKQFNNQ